MGTGMENCIPKFWEQESERKMLFTTNTFMRASYRTFDSCPSALSSVPKIWKNANWKSNTIQVGAMCAYEVFSWGTDTDRRVYPRIRITGPHQTQPNVYQWKGDNVSDNCNCNDYIKTSTKTTRRKIPTRTMITETTDNSSFNHADLYLGLLSCFSLK